VRKEIFITRVLSPGSNRKKKKEKRKKKKKRKEDEIKEKWNKNCIE